MKLNKFLTALFATLLTCSLASAGGYKHKKKHCPNNGGSASDCRDEGSIDVFGEVPICLDLLVIDTNAEIDFENLGKVAINNRKVGQFSVDSNAADGFSLTFSSSQSGELVKVGSAGGPTQSVSYLVDLDRTGGVLGSGTAEPAVTSGLSLASPVTLDFAGTAVEPTIDLTYDVDLSVPANNSLEAGVYSDTITIQLAAL